MYWLIAGWIVFAGSAAGADETWTFDRLDRIGGHSTTVLGEPRVIETKIGKAVEFDGVDDALLVDAHPLASAKTFTWEAIFRPDGGPFEQRWFHLAEQDPKTKEDTGNRMLFEIRVIDGQWCLDSYVEKGDIRKALLNRQHLHSLGDWHHVAAVYDGREFRSYVDGVLDGSSPLQLSPQGPGHASIGMRINRVFYFKGAVQKARFTQRALSPAEFLKPGR